MLTFKDIPTDKPITYEISIGEFNDQTPKIKVAIDKLLEGKHLVIEVVWTFEASRWERDLFNLQCIMDMLRREQGIKVWLYIRYLPNARMDRTDDETAFTLWSFARIINKMYFVGVKIDDPHSDTALNLIDRSYPGSISDRYAAVCKKVKNPLIVFPDEGALYRYAKDIPEDVPVTHCKKTRDWNTQHVTDMKLMNPEMVKGKDVVLIDDIIAHGYTMYLAIKEIEEYSPKSITIYATHIEESFIDGILCQKLNEGEIEAQVYTTGSIIRKWDKVPEYFHILEGTE
jgi:phosphoribosylpyrophosphate synthetase